MGVLRPASGAVAWHAVGSFGPHYRLLQKEAVVWEGAEMENWLPWQQSLGPWGIISLQVSHRQLITKAKIATGTAALPAQTTLNPLWKLIRSTPSPHTRVVTLSASQMCSGGPRELREGGESGFEPRPHLCPLSFCLLFTRNTAPESTAPILPSSMELGLAQEEEAPSPATHRACPCLGLPVTFQGHCPSFFPPRGKTGGAA